MKIVKLGLSILSYLLVAFTTFAWISRLRISDSELLPILLVSVINLLIFILYKKLDKNTELSKNKFLKYIYQGGFYINFFFIGLCIVVIIGFGIIP